jgi:uncharacterized protein YdeI (YjbR/CyaY-like superfamily)
VTIGFIRDTTDEDEYFLVITPKRGEPSRIPVEDIDEIEHIEETLEFYVHYQSR